MKIVDKKLSEIRPYEKNPRNNKNAVKYVKKSIEKFGFKVPIVIDGNGVIVAGHTRYKASQELGLETVPCVIADDLTEKQIKAFRLADNKTAEFATWDFDLLSDELDDLKLDFDMGEFGFDFSKDDESDDSQFEDIDDDDNGDTVSHEYRLKCGNIDLILTEQEYELFSNRYEEYVKKNGVSFGFILEILKND